MSSLNEWFIATADAEATTSIAIGVSGNRQRHERTDESSIPRAVGKLFEFARRALGLSIEEFSHRSGIPRPDLVSIEAGQFDAFPSTRVAYVARELNLPETGILRLIAATHPSVELHRAAESLVCTVHDSTPLPQEAIAFRDLVVSLGSE